MGSDVSKTVFRGIVIPDPAISNETISVTYSEFTQAGPVPGVPEDTSTPNSKMVLQATGVQPADSQLRLQAIRGGFPGVSERAGGYAYQDEADNTWYGWDTPNIFLGWDSLNYSTDAGGLARHQQPQVIRLLSGNLLLVTRGSGTLVSGSTSDYIPTIRLFDADTGSWSVIANITPKNNTNSNLHPCLCQLPSGRVLLFFWVVNGPTDEANIEMWYSDDDGDNWQVGSEFCLEDSIDTAAYNVKRLRAAYNMGQVLLVGQIDFQAPTGFNEPEALVQWASDDLGARFIQVYVFDHEALESGGYHDVLPLSSGGFAVMYNDTVASFPEIRKINNAYHSLGEVGGTTIPTRENIGDDLAVWSGEDGTWYLAYYTPGVVYDTTVIRSLDEGDNWARMEGSTGTASFHGLWKDGDGEMYPTDFTAAETRGRTAFVTRWSTPNAANGLYSISVLWLGGHSNLTMPSYSLFRDDVTQMAWSRTWIGMEEPDQLGDVWDAHPSGSPTVSLGSNGLNITTGNPDANYYDLNTTAAPYPPSAVEDDFVYFFQFKVTSGGSLNSRYVAIQVRTADSNDDYEAGIYLTTTGYRVRDMNTGLQIGSDQTIDLTATSQLLISLSEGRVRTWHRNVNDGDLERQWETGINQTLTSDTATPNTYGDCIWGHISPGGAGAESYWQIVCWGQMPTGVTGLSGGQTNPDDLNPRFFSRLPAAVPNGVKIQAVDGPVFSGETFSIDTRYQHPITHIDPAISPSPRQTWRSTDTTGQRIAWEMATSDRRSFTKNLALYLCNTNVPSFTVAGRNSGGGWNNLVTVTNGYRDLKFTRYGDALYVNTGAANPTGVKWLQHSELVGGHLVLTSGNLDQHRRVGSNSDGIWTEATAQRPVIHIHRDDYTDSEHASGDLDVIFPNVGVTLLNIANFHALRITIPAATTEEGYF